MRISVRSFILLLGLSSVSSLGVSAQQDTTRITRLQEEVDAITRELEALRLGSQVVARADTGISGMGPAASKVYQAKPGVSIGGYGEVIYQNYDGKKQDDSPANLTDRFDALRAIVYVGYRFTDRLIFNSEIEFEHGSTEDNGDVSLEFGYLEYRHSRPFGVRAGLLLSPMGFINEMHEPPTYLGTTRPETERQIIPSTWRENGVGILGEVGKLEYRAYVINGFDGTGFEADGLREGRQDGSEAAARHFGAVARLGITPMPGFTVSASAYHGNSGQRDSLAAATTIWEAHAEFRRNGLELRGLYTQARVHDVDELNALNGFIGSESIGERLSGWYLQAGFDVLRSSTTHQLIPFVRYESLNTQDRVPTGFSADPSNDRRILTVGFSWKPIPDVVLKADYQVNHNETETGVNQFNVALGYLF